MYKGTKLLKPLIRRLIYSVICLLFMPCGTKLSLYFLFQGDVASCGASDQSRDHRAALMRWTRGPSDQNSNTCLKTHLSELISAVYRDRLTAEINPIDEDAMNHRSIVTAGSKSNDQIKTTIHIKRTYDRSRQSRSSSDPTAEIDFGFYINRSSRREDVFAFNPKILLVYSIKSRAVCFLVFVSDFRFQ